MAHIETVAPVDVEDPMLVEGLPGVGLVGKIAADHLVSEFGMTHHANVHCDALPSFATYDRDNPQLRTPLRLYADADRDLLVLQSDVLVSPSAATEFADCVSGWFAEEGVTPIYLSGVPWEDETTVPAVTGVAAGEGQSLLERVGIDPPSEPGLVSGPTGALLNHAIESHLTAVGLLVETDPNFPDPAAAKVLIEDGIEPLAEIDANVEALVERSERVREAKQRLIDQLQGQEEKSSRAQPLRMYQ